MRRLVYWLGTYFYMRIHQAFWALALCISPLVAACQEVSAPEPQGGSIIGTVVDVNDDVVPAATVAVDGPTPNDHAVLAVNDSGFFVFKDLRPAVAYHVTIHAAGFADWVSPELVLKPNQQVDMGGIQLRISVVETSVTAVLPEQLALEQVRAEEKQRVLGIIPNFYTVYDPNAVPLTTKLKFRLALRASTDAATIAGSALLAGMNQAADTPAYGQGAKGYGQRFGASYADGVSGILIGGAILPSLLHQDPRYFYQGTDWRCDSADGLE
jgi:hypothetical protein